MIILKSALKSIVYGIFPAIVLIIFMLAIMNSKIVAGIFAFLLLALMVGIFIRGLRGDFDED